MTPEIDVHGRRVHEAMDLIEKAAKAAIRAGSGSISVIHGIGADDPSSIRGRIRQEADTTWKKRGWRIVETSRGGRTTIFFPIR